MNKLRIERHDLYNVLKFIRNNNNVSSLGLTKVNIVDIIYSIYRV
jgi:hypothetical protein